MTIKYVSTRGNAPTLSFEDAVLAGLASDGGLYVPESIPAFTMAEIAGMQAMSYPELAFTIISRFTEGSIEPEALERMIADAYATFRHDAVAPLKQLDVHTFLLELFHGPTLAFKDFALQFLGRLLDHILTKRGQKAVIVGATSGDTGSAAISGCSGRDNIEIFILHPQGRVSEVQRRQMTSVLDKNVHNIALKGTFDDCQDMVKTLFSDHDFRDKYKLTAVNSINWARIMAQVVYYFYAALALGAPAKRISFSVPTGNFGDIYAGVIAGRLGLPIDQLIIATNRNDILTRCLNTGTYGMEGVTASLSPSMDIQISSNFERLLFDLYGRDGKQINDMMTRFRSEKKLTLTPGVWEKLKGQFAASAISDEDTKATIASIYQSTGELLDPHSAVGVAAGHRARRDTGTPLVVLATAHPAKFPDAVKAACHIHPPLPEHMKDLFERQERFDVLDNDVDTMKRYISERV